MIRATIITTIALLGFMSCLFGQNRPDTVSVQSGSLQLKALLWHPEGFGKLPAVIFCHGSYETNDITYDPVTNISSIGYIFAQHGYIFLGLFRRGVALSRGVGTNTADLMAKALKARGQEGRNAVQLTQMETVDLNDVIAGLDFLRRRNDVDTSRMAVAGHSFGGSLALLVAEHEPALKAVIVFSAAGYSWDRSPALRSRLITAAQHISRPLMIIHARNDYSLSPGYGLDSVLTALGKPHLLKIYPEFGSSKSEAHNLVFLATDVWEADVFRFLDAIVKH